MARPDALIAAYKAMPGAAVPTPAPQGALGVSAPGMGRISPLAQQLANERGYANVYGPYLPRMPRTFTQGAFGPFSPILPVPVDEPAEGAEMPDARLWPYYTGWNLPVGEPGTEGIKLASFGTLKTLADLYSVARACIELRKNEVTGLDWDIVPTKDAAKTYNGKRDKMKDFGERRGQVLAFFEKPDPDYFSFRSFMSALMEEIFVFDALSILIRPKRGRGLHRGVLGTDLDCLELISGPTMRPLVGMHGETPRPPSPAYQQYLYGVPRSDYMTLITQRDLDEHGLLGAEVNAWSADQFLYLPLVPRRWTPYGFPPVERALVPVMSGLQKQAYQLDFFKEGTIPAVYVSPGDINMTPSQIRELQDALNAFAGDPAWHHKVIVLPPGSKVDPQKPVDLADQFDDIVMTQVCQAFDVNPMEIGILPKVAATATPSAVKQFAQQGAGIHERLSTKPTLMFLADIFDAILHDVLSQHDMKFTFAGLSEDAEEQALTQLLVQQVQSGLRSVDEARDELELQPWGLPMTSLPVIFTAAGPVPFEQQALPATPGQQQGGQQKMPGPNPDKRVANGQRRAPTAGTAPLQQAGRQGGQATPGHAAAAGALAAQTGRLRNTQTRMVAPSARGSISAVKSELDMLVRHLNKGRQISTWQPKYVTGQVLAMISEDLAKGLSPEQCRDIASTIVLGRDDYAVTDNRDVTGDREGFGDRESFGDDDSITKDEAEWEDLIRQAGPKADAAFTAALPAISTLIDQWWEGQVVLPRLSLLGEVSAILYGHLEPALKDIWAEAWRSEDGTAGGYYDAWEASHGRDILERIVTSRLQQVDDAISTAIRNGSGPDAVTSRLDSLLDAGSRGEMIATTETARAATAAAERAFIALGVTHKLWITRDDGKVCQVCRDAEEEGPVPLGSLFRNRLEGPPAHPRCRCHLEPYAHPPLPHLQKDATLTKEQAHYRLSSGDEFCGNCSMIRVNPPDFESYACTLVKGIIEPQDVCDHWDADKADKGIHGEERSVWCARKDCREPHHGEHGAAGLLIRSKGPDGQWRYLLQKRSGSEDTGQGTWGLFGGALLPGETPVQGGFREAQEEMGPLPRTITEHHHVVDDHGPSTYRRNAQCPLHGRH